jgi:regulatory protein
MKKVKLDNLNFEEKLELAMNKLIRSCSAYEQSSIKIRRKLEMAGFNQEVIDAALEKAQRYSYIDDTRYCECLIRTAMAQGKGLRNVLPEVQSLNIDPEDLEAYNEYISTPEEDFIEQALSLLKRKPPHSKNIRASAYRRLISKGYDMSVASKAVGLYMESLADEL